MQNGIEQIIDKLKSIERFDIDPHYNGDFIELDHRIEEDGKYIKSSDLLNVIAKLRGM